MLNLIQKKKEINIYQNSMILEKYQNIFVEGEARTLDEKGVLIGYNFEDDGYKIFHNCDCHYGARFTFNTIDMYEIKAETEYITIGEDDGFDLIFPFINKYIPNFDPYDFVNPLKANTFVLMAEEMLKEANILRSGNKLKQADFIEAFVWYFKEHKKIDDCSSLMINICGY